MSPVNMNDKFDLSKLAPTGGGNYVLDVTEANFESVASLSVQHPVVLELTLTSAQETKGVDDALVELTNEAAGRWLLARVDVGTSPRVAQALGVHAVPTVLALIAGQVAPLFQGTREKDAIKTILDQVVKAAIANGVTGRAKPVEGGPVAGGESGGEAAPAAPSRFAAADEALSRGDLAGAEAEFDKLLAANPRDPAAASGKAQIGLLQRVQKLDPTAVLVKAGANPGDADAQLEAADVEMAQGQSEAAFNRLIQTVRQTSDKTRERVRLRLVELFSTMPPQDPAVAKARRDLMTALF